MAKQTGLGDAFLVGVKDLSGNTQGLGSVRGGVAVIDVTDITQSAYARLGGHRDGGIDWTSYFDPAAGASHATLSALPSTDILCTYCRGTTIGSPAASIVAKQVNYDGTRAADGGFTFAVNAVANGFGLEWGQLLTAVSRTDTATTNGASIDTAASASFGWSAFLHVTAFTGTSVVVKIQDSADDASWADVSGAAFTTVTGATSERITASSTTATVRRYVRAITAAAGGFTSITFAVNFAKHIGAEVTY
jgi:hypothetical protein